jgi:hypothetical protein
MRRLTIHLHHVESTGGKSYNTLAYIFRKLEEANRLITKHGDNVKKAYISNLN